MQATGAAFDRIKSQVSDIDGGIADIAGQTVDQSNALKQVNVVISEIDQIAIHNASMAEEASAACVSLTRECERLMEMVGRFKLGDAAPRRRRAA